MSGWDRGEVYHANLLASQPPDIANSKQQLLKRCTAFFESFRLSSSNHFVYRYLGSSAPCPFCREQIVGNVNARQFHVVVNLAHVQAFDEELMNQLLTSPLETIELVLFVKRRRRTNAPPL